MFTFNLRRSLSTVALVSAIAIGVGMSSPLQAEAAPVRVYVAGESIERRNCMSEAPFTSTGALNNPGNNDTEQYGWMIPFAEKLKLRRPGLAIEFVGAGGWLAGDDSPYNGRGACSFYPTPGRTSAMSGSDNETWLERHGAELRNKQFCYDIAFVSRGGNDRETDNTFFKDNLKEIIRLAVQGSSCNTNPLVYVTGHMPDREVNATTGEAKFVTRVRAAVTEYLSTNSAARVRFIDQFTPFKNNTPTTAFPNPNWRSGTGFNMNVIGRDGDGLHPKRFASIYAGEIAANAIDLNELSSVLGGSTGGTTTPTPAPAPTPTPAPPVTVAPVAPVSAPAPEAPAPTVPSTPVSTGAQGITSAVGRYDIGTPTLQDVWIDPVGGNDANTGASRERALRTVNEAWRRIPANRPLTTGYRFLLTRGTYPTDTLPNFWDDRVGTAQFPIILQSIDGRGAAVLTGSINSAGLAYFYLIDLTIAPIPARDTLHFERGDHILLRGVTLNGGNRQAHETLKVNQTKYMYIEDSDISGAGDNAIDFVAVQYGHVLNTKIHNAGDWCIYTKGGSAQIRLEGNEIYNCGVGGYVAGQGTGVQYLVPPWIHYEAYDIKFVNNVIHDTGTAGMGVNGGYNILLAHNTLYRVGIGLGGNRADHLFEANFGLRGCDPGDDRVNCPAMKALGAWGSNTPEEAPIPNKNIFVYNNLFVNPSGTSAPYPIQVAAPRAPFAGSGLTGRIVADENLQFKGNVIVNAANDLGLSDDGGCAVSHPTCNPAQLQRDNRINSVQVRFVNAAQGDFRLADTTGLEAMSIPAFAGGDRHANNTPVGELVNGVSVDRSGATRTGGNAVGAYVSGATSLTSAPAPAPTPAPTPSPTPSPSPRPEPISTPSPRPVPSAASLHTDLGIALFATPYPRVAQGATVAYRVTVKNDGPGTAQGVIAELPTPANTDLVSLTRASRAGCATNTRGVRCAFDGVRSGATITFVVTYRPRVAGTFVARGTVESTTYDPALRNNASEVPLTVTPAPMANLVGRWISATQTCRMVRGVERCTAAGRFEVKNTGNKTAPAHRVTITLSSNQTLESRDVLLKTYTVGTLAPGGTRFINVVLPVIPVILHPGYLIGSVDATNIVPESNERDNLAVAEIR